MFQTSVGGKLICIWIFTSEKRYPNASATKNYLFYISEVQVPPYVNDKILQNSIGSFSSSQVTKMLMED